MSSSFNHSKATAAGVLMTLGIIFGDIGTSPLYVMRAIIGDAPIDEDLVLGGISCVFWTLTIQTTLKYIILTLQADNNGEGGIFSLYALIRRRGNWLVIPTIIGAAMLLADGIITPPISISSAIEGLHEVNPNIPTLTIIITILVCIFLFQQFGTSLVGKSFGPMMVVWFSMMAILGFIHIVQNPIVLRAFSPHYAIQLLVQHPGGFWLLGAVFLCTTGAEALYSDLGHCGRSNIQVAWIFVKTALLLNYFGQGAWLLKHSGETLGRRNPFYELMPEWFLIVGIIIASIAAIIASQALISGSFTLISEAIGLNIWPRVEIHHPSESKGQHYIPSVNWFLLIGCISVQLYFRESSNMEGAYGFAITMTMLMTTTLLIFYLRYVRKAQKWLIFIFLTVFLTVEGSFFIANIIKLKTGWAPLLFAVFTLGIMLIWQGSKKLLSRFTVFVDLEPFLKTLENLSQAEKIPKFATHLIYLTKSENPLMIEHKIIPSIFGKKPKRADIYWFVHLERTDAPYTMEYSVQELVNDKIIRVDFRIGFKVQLRLNLFFKQVMQEMMRTKEIPPELPSESRYNLESDFRFVVSEKFLSIENDLPFKENFLLKNYFALKKWSLSVERAFGLDENDVTVEKFPLVVVPATDVMLTRIEQTAVEKAK
ncbi:MAG: KUP/HAK/KT family potassium transporter [Chloroherpetonaceae bacterium]|nr:KUP/HAK/KT family potassium transporter [Chloroherpetonaceae bacterium]